MIDPALKVWIYKPNVIHKLIFGSRIAKNSDCLVERIIYPKLYVDIEPFEEVITITKSGELILIYILIFRANFLQIFFSILHIHHYQIRVCLS